MIISLLGMTQE